VKFLNDVEAMAFGILFTKKGKNLLSPKEEEKNPHAPKILFTIGTGLGLSLIMPYFKSAPMIMPSECWAI
jgi:glucokinase